MLEELPLFRTLRGQNRSSCPLICDQSLILRRPPGCGEIGEEARMQRRGESSARTRPATVVSHAFPHVPRAVVEGGVHYADKVEWLLDAERRQVLVDALVRRVNAYFER
jgi:hypothetical protein